MTREEAIAYGKRVIDLGLNDETHACCEMALEALEQEQKWIPIKTRPLTDEESEYYSSLGFPSEEMSFIYDCPLPDDGQSVLITNRYNSVDVDTFYNDDGCYFEDNCDEDDVLAWMPLPERYKKGDQNEN